MQQGAKFVVRSVFMVGLWEEFGWNAPASPARRTDRSYSFIGNLSLILTPINYLCRDFDHRKEKKEDREGFVPVQQSKKCA